MFLQRTQVVLVKNSPANAGDLRDAGLTLGGEDPLEEGMATHSSVLAWRIPWMEDSGGLQSVGSQRIRNNWRNFTCMHVFTRYWRWSKTTDCITALTEIFSQLLSLATQHLRTLLSLTPSGTTIQFLSCAAQKCVQFLPNRPCFPSGRQPPFSLWCGNSSDCPFPFHPVGVREETQLGKRRRNPWILLYKCFHHLHICGVVPRFRVSLDIQNIFGFFHCES